MLKLHRDTMLGGSRHFDEAATGTGGAAPAAPSAPAPASSEAPAAATPSTPAGNDIPVVGPDDKTGSGNDEFVLPDFSDDDGDSTPRSDEVVVLRPGAEPPKPAAPAQTPPAQAAPAQVPPQQQQQPPAQQPAQPPQQPQQAQPPAQQDQPTLDPTNPAEVAAYLLQNKDVAVQGLAKEVYNLSQEEVEGLETNAYEVIPSLLARVHVNVAAATMNRMAEMLPAMMQRHMQAVQRNTSNADMFYEQNKHLDRNDPNVNAAVAQYARLYRAQNPTASKQDMVKAVGLLVSQSLGIAIPAPTQQPAQAPAPAPAGFIPAQGGGGPPPVVKPSSDPWAGMGQDFDN